tara:strand:+ start:47 stop:274 length:228 start_codon:yes stop_codon:yes gene_type:complete
MAHEKQDWKDALQAAKPEGSRLHDDSDQRKKKEARIMYSRRVLQKDINNYIKSNNGPIRYSDIESIGRKHGFYTT